MLRFAILIILLAAIPASAENATNLIDPSHRLHPGEPVWQEWVAQVQKRADAEAKFEERRWFSFKKTATILTGEVRVSGRNGLSLHYLEPEERTVIIDERGMLMREAGRESATPADPRASAVNGALLNLLRFNLSALAETFELYGERVDSSWTIALVPLAKDLRRSIGEIVVTGENAFVRHIELRRSKNQRVEILIAPATILPEGFSADDVRRYFR